MNIQRGFTVIELMIAIMVLGIIATVAVPSFAGILKQNRLATQANTILSSMNYARGQTISQNVNVTITPLVAGNDWSAGWAINAGGDVRNFEGFENAALTLAHPDLTPVTQITYLADGTITAPDIIEMTITPNDCSTGDPDLRVVTISLSGQARSAPGNCP